MTQTKLRAAGTVEPFLGLIELDNAGTILYARIDSPLDQPSIHGSNFFTDLRPFDNIDQFKTLLQGFSASRLSVGYYDFVCRYEGGVRFPTRVLISRIRERSDGMTTPSLLVQFKPDG